MYYSPSHREHEYAQYVIETVKRLFTNDDMATSFLQSNKQAAKPETIEKVVSHLSNCLNEAETNLIEKKSYTRMFKVLSQIAEGMKEFSDPALVNRLVYIHTYTILQNRPALRLTPAQHRGQRFA